MNLTELSQQNTESRKAHKYQILTGYALKIIGIIFMVLDHVHQMFAHMGAPIWLTMVGRIVAPIFLFLAAEGFHYTRNKKSYMLRLWIGYFLMSIITFVIQKVMPVTDVVLINSIFGTLFLSVLYMWLIDMLKTGIKSKSTKKVVSSIAGMIIPVALCFALTALISVSPYAMLIFNAFIPTPIMVEGGFVWIILAVAFYVLRSNRILQILPLLLLSAFYLFFTESFQWIMIFAAIPILMYNGKPGRKSKYFFYIFYPSHIYVLYFIAYIIERFHS